MLKGVKYDSGRKIEINFLDQEFYRYWSPLIHWVMLLAVFTKFPGKYYLRTMEEIADIQSALTFNIFVISC